MFGFDKMFDFNRDGKLDSWERAAQFQFMDEMMKDDEKSIFDDDDEIDTFADAGLDYDELEFMDPDERREVLEDAGLDPDEFDFSNWMIQLGIAEADYGLGYLIWPNERLLKKQGKQENTESYLWQFITCKV